MLGRQGHWACWSSLHSFSAAHLKFSIKALNGLSMEYVSGVITGRVSIPFSILLTTPVWCTASAPTAKGLAHWATHTSYQ